MALYQNGTLIGIATNLNPQCGSSSLPLTPGSARRTHQEREPFIVRGIIDARATARQHGPRSGPRLASTEVGHGSQPPPKAGVAADST